MAKGLSATQRTLRELRRQGRVCGIVERYLSYAGQFGKRSDLFNIIDIIALDPERGVVGVQSATEHAAHFRKITEEYAQNTKDWLETPGTNLELWVWRKVKAKRGGKAEIWQPRITEITLEDLQ